MKSLCTCSTPHRVTAHLMSRIERSIVRVLHHSYAGKHACFARGANENTGRCLRGKATLVGPLKVPQRRRGPRPTRRAPVEQHVLPKDTRMAIDARKDTRWRCAAARKRDGYVAIKSLMPAFL